MYLIMRRIAAVVEYEDGLRGPPHFLPRRDGI